ncbi:PIN-like domain-containing protein [Chishuiella sp.]|uniref:PIN-like domain-containing protein n=1 Tax=Chishuiella sp. TaxID=1969467 RepID=UPI0028B114A2|nr:PIN-like domain-containing protein [Chishuiella sp.]
MSKIELISDEFSFKAKREIKSLNEYWECLKKFDKESKEIISEKNNYPIFVDTNFLLKYYEISLESRKKFFSYIKENKERIYITRHVQKEFIKNREKTIKGFNSSKIKPTLKSLYDVIKQFNNFKNQSKYIINDQKDITEKIEQIDKEFEGLNKFFEEDFQKKYQFDIFSNDEYLDLILGCHILDDLDENEISIIKKHFSELEVSLKSTPIEKNIDLRFPGCSDIDKEINKEGDFIIYHEILKNIKILNKSVIFLTYDSTKSDWFHSDKKTVMHYVYNSYNNTNQILHIIDAERYLPDIYNIDHDVLEDSYSNKPSPSYFDKLFDSNIYGNIEDEYGVLYPSISQVNDSNKIENFHFSKLISLLISSGIELDKIELKQLNEKTLKIYLLLLENNISIQEFKIMIVRKIKINDSKEFVIPSLILDEIIYNLKIYIKNNKF